MLAFELTPPEIVQAPAGMRVGPGTDVIGRWID